MLHGPGHLLRGRRSGAPDDGAGTTTLEPDGDARGADPAHSEETMFGDVPPATRLQMELVACASETPAEALPVVIDLLVDGSAAKRRAIVTAISENDPLREQWERTWAVLRG